MSYYIMPVSSAHEAGEFINILNNNLYLNGSAPDRYSWFYEGGHAKAYLLYEFGGSEPIGTIGFRYRKFKTPLGILTGALAADLAINKDKRNIQAALQFVNIAVDAMLKHPDVDFIYTIPNKNSSMVIKRTGLFTSLGNFERYVKLISFEEVFKDKPYRFITPFLNMGWNIASYVSNFGNILKHTNGMNDAAWDSYSKDDTLMGFRDYDYLTWRYLDANDGYQTFQICDDGKYAFLIYKIIKNRAYVVDLLYPFCDDEMLVKLFATFEQRMFAEDRSMIVVQSLGCDSVINTLSDELWYKPYSNSDKEILVATTDDPVLQCLADCDSYWFAGDEDAIQ